MQQLQTIMLNADAPEISKTRAIYGILPSSSLAHSISPIETIEPVGIGTDSTAMQLPLIHHNLIGSNPKLSRSKQPCNSNRPSLQEKSPLTFHHNPDRPYPDPFQPFLQPTSPTAQNRPALRILTSLLLLLTTPGRTERHTLLVAVPIGPFIQPPILCG